MIILAKRMNRDLNALRRQLAPFGASLPPLALPLLDSLKEQVDALAGREQAAYVNLGEVKPVRGEEHGQSY